MDYQHYQPPANKSDRDSSRTENGVVAGDNKESIVKIKRPQGGGTVRSIPIKDYQASLAHNVGTLRRSVVPQMQFESLVSEPEKNTCSSTKPRISIINNTSYGPNHSRPINVAHTESSKDVTKCTTCHHCNCQHEVHRVKPSERSSNVNQNLDHQDDSQDFADLEQYFRRSSSRKRSSNRRKRNIKNVSHREEINCNNGDVGTSNSQDEDENSKRQDPVDAGRSNVVQKISAYEENSRRATHHRNSKRRSFPEMKHRTIGVPLVGMHNACGLPVVASWHDDILQPLRISSRVVGTLGPVLRGSRVTSNIRRRTHPKRRAPQPTPILPDKSCIFSSRNIDYGTSKSPGNFEINNNNKNSRRKKRRPSFKTAKVGSLSSKNSFKRTLRIAKYGDRRSSLIDTFGKKSKGSKRATLYARDDGEDAVQVLKNLCLNPLARNKSETNMMW